MDRARPRLGRFLVTAIPYVWLIVFFLIPFFIVFKISLSTTELAQPPYAPVLDPIAEGLAATWEKVQAFSADNYRRLITESIYVESYVSSLIIATTATVLMLVVGYPIAYGMAKAPKSVRPTLLMLIILPFWTSFLIRVYAWIGILSQEGLLNTALRALGLIDEPLEILSTNTAVYIGIVYSYLPFMVLPLYSALEKMDDTLIEAAQDLGCTPFQAFWRVTFPLSLPGVLAGSLLVFIPSVGEFVIPDLLGGSDTVMIGKTLWEEFFQNRDWPAAAAVAIVLLFVLVVPIVLFQNSQARLQEGGR